jgi:positive regulator of sigma E activity
MGMLIHTFDKKGIVTALLPYGIEVIPEEDCTSEGGCNGGCGSCAGKQKRSRKFTLNLDSPRAFRTGQHVTFRYRAYHETLGALIVFGLPLLFAMTALVIWYLLRPEMVESGWALLSSAFGLVLGFGLVRVIDRIFSRTYPPVLLSADTTPPPLPPSAEYTHDG